jgi:hypothetical protein
MIWTQRSSKSIRNEKLKNGKWQKSGKWKNDHNNKMDTFDVQPCILQQLEENGVPPELCVQSHPDLTCNICFNVLRSPKSICQHEHFYCAACLMKSNDTCPACRINASGPLVESRMLNNRLEELEVSCYTTLGVNRQTVGKKRKGKSKTTCEWRGKMSQLHHHLQHECLCTYKKNLKLYTLEKDNKRLKRENDEQCRTHSESMNSFKKSYVDKLNKWKDKLTSETNYYRRQIDELERERNESLTKLQFLIEANKDFNRIIVMLHEHTEKLEREKNEMSGKIEQLEREKNEMSGKIEQLEREGERFTDLFQKQPFVFKAMCGVIFLGISSDIRIVNRTCLVFFLCYMFVDRFL